jgi:surfeit locus 1 family protein
VNRFKQVLIVTLGLLLAAAMAALGVWQLNVYRSQGNAAAEAKAAAPPLDLRLVAPAGTAVREGFGRSVAFQGRYQPTLQLLVPVAGSPNTFRILSGLRQSDGSIVPVVRGLTGSTSPPKPPTGGVSQVGVLLPSEDDGPDTPVGAGQLSSVRLPTLAQLWPGPLISGFVTLSATDARAQGLEPATPQLPRSQGRLRNGAYAFQWWVFGAFTIAMAFRIARDFGLREDLPGVEKTEMDLEENPT